MRCFFCWSCWVVMLVVMMVVCYYSGVRVSGWCRSQQDRASSVGLPLTIDIIPVLGCFRRASKHFFHSKIKKKWQVQYLQQAVTRAKTYIQYVLQHHDIPHNNVKQPQSGLNSFISGFIPRGSGRGGSEKGDPTRPDPTRPERTREI